VNLPFVDPKNLPKPKEEIKIESLRAEVYPDRWRLKVNIDVTPFLVRPNLALALIKEGGAEMAGSASIIETMHRNMEFTLHIRPPGDPAGRYTLKARLYFEAGFDQPNDETQIEIIVPPAES
jgi:hypothetical protein